MSSAARWLGQGGYVRPLAPAALAKVAHLHDLGQRRLVDRVGRRLGIVALQDIHVLVERAFVVELLQEALVPFALLLARAPRVLHVFLEALRLGQRTPPRDLFLLFAPRLLFGLHALDPAQLAETPRGKLRVGVEIVGIVHVDRLLLVLLLTELALHTLCREIVRGFFALFRIGRALLRGIERRGRGFRAVAPA